MKTFITTARPGWMPCTVQGITGKGVTVAVVDSGLWEHDALVSTTLTGRNRVLARYDALTDAPRFSEVVDESGHGTHIVEHHRAQRANATQWGALRARIRGWRLTPIWWR